MAEVERQGSARIFISYRREDSAGFVRALLTPLRERFGGDRIFKDTDNIPPGQDFVEAIQRELDSCRVLLSVIGKAWATVEDPRTKKRRIENPGDYLRIEVATALKNEHVIVIPVLVDHAGMPRAEDLPEELQLLARRNAIELSDSRWDADVERLIHAIEGICNDEPALPRKERIQPPPPDPLEDAKPPSVDTGGGFEHVERKRKRQIAEHMKVAREAFAAQDFEAVVAACERAIWLDPQEPAARDFATRARAAIDEREIQNRLAEAQVALAKGELAAASEAIDAALARSPDHAGAAKLRQDLLRLRQERERRREVDRLLAAEIKSAKSLFDEEDFSAALSHIDDALALGPESSEARELRERIVAARDEQHRARELKRRAQQAVSEAQVEFAGGKHDAALSRLEQFAPPHELVNKALEDLRRRAEEARETARREKAGQDAVDAAARARRDADAALAKAAEALKQQQFAAAQELVEAARKADPTHPDVAQLATRISEASAAEAAAERARREREEQARREETARLAAVAKDKREKEEQAKREQAARLAAAEAEKVKREKEEQAKREEAANRAREETRRREDEARRAQEEARLEKAVADKLEAASRIDDHDVAVVLLNEALALAQGDKRLQTLIGERITALDQLRIQALEIAAAEEALRRQRQREAREERTRREREAKEERARLAQEKKAAEAREPEPRAQRPAQEEAAAAAEPKPVWIKYLAAAAIVVFAITAGRLLFRNPPTDDTQAPPQEQAQGPTTSGPTQGPTTGEPTRGPTIPAPTPGPAADAPARGPTTAAPTPGRATNGPSRGPNIPGATRGPTVAAPTQGRATAGPAQAPTTVGPAQGSTTTGPTQGPATAGPAQTPTTAGPTQGPANPGPTQGPAAAAPTQGPTAAGPAQGSTPGAPTGNATPAGPNLAAERAALQQMLDRYIAAYTAMDESALKQLDPTFRGIPSRQLLKSVALKLSQVSIDVRPDGQSAGVRATQNFSYAWNRSGFPATSTGTLMWNLRKAGTTWTIVP